ncbi:MAG: type II toxin-antitoxin system RelE/ParE family toxin [Oscillospiraceae bacterium]|nr:type II toxin-antitoxin system RelE/ParE family toxin [Oscillospiraceae bacterium]
MKKINYSHEALNDLVEIERYIREELMSPIAAKNTIAKIAKNVRLLEGFAELGAMLSSITDIDNDYRYLVCGKYLAFYRIFGTDIFVIRIIFGSRDYLSILFDEENTFDTELKSCLLCKNSLENKETTFRIEIEECNINIINVPSHVCSACGEVSFSDDVFKELESIVFPIRESFNRAKQLGLVEAERFIALLRREPFDYTEWRQGLFADVPLEKFLQDAQNFRDSMDKQ